MSQELQRLNKLVARATGKSRRQVDELIEKQQVKVDGQLAEMGMKISSDAQVELLNKKSGWDRVNLLNDDQTILFYKPIFCVTSRKGQNKDKTIYDFLPKQYHPLKPAGRLDYMSEGLLAMSSDGGKIHQLTHPRNNSAKIYLVGLLDALTFDQIEMLEQGVVIDDYTTEPIEIEELAEGDDEFEQYDYLKLQPNFTWYLFTLHEGRNNQIRKMVGLMGQRVKRLIRVKHGEFELTKELYEKKVLVVNKK
jgi:pseudouridine synthase